uniref:GAG-pre-integrase domain-containing protein n=1 Tax=Tanacetum cinerariifolium TaxID=118510 RepID=A0A699IH94_TANCI|nr:hypothetical protein [Tanacetum cinerariifolium]
MQASLQGKDNAIRRLKKHLFELQVTSSDTERTVKVRTTDSQLTKLYDSIKITRAKHIEQVTKLTAENVTLKTGVSKAKVQPSVLTRTKHAVDVKLIVPRLRNNRDAHLDYFRHLKESVETIRDIVEEAKVVRPLDRSIVSACRYTQHSQELLEYAIGTYPMKLKSKDLKERTKVSRPIKALIVYPPNTPATLVPKARCLALEAELANLRDTNNHDNQKELINHFSKLETTDSQITKLTVQVTNLQAQNALFRNENDKIKQHYKDFYDSIKITRAKHIEQTNVHVPPSTGVNSCPNASRSQPKSHVKPNKISPAKGVNKLPVEDQPRTNKSHLRTSNRVDSSSRLKRTVINSNSDSIFQTCNKCLTSSNHDMCVATCLPSIVATPSIHHNCNVERKVKQVWKPKQVRQVWKPTSKVLTTIGHQWRPTGRTFHLRNQFPLTRFTPPKVVSAKQNKKQASCSKHMTRDRSRLMNFMKKFIGTVRFGNDHFGAIMGYGDYVIVAFRKHSCYVRDTDGVELIKGSRGSNLYTISVEDMMNSSPICLLSKASKNKSCLWHRRSNHLNFGTINDLARKGLVRGLPRLKFEKDHLCSACQLGKSKKHTHKPKAENTNLEVLNTLHMDLCGPMRVQTINGKKYILVIVDDYSWFTWVKFLRSKDETLDLILEYLLGIHQAGKGPAPNFLTPGQISSGLVPNSVPATPYAPPTNKELEILFQPMFDEYLEPPRAKRSVSPAQAEQAPVNSAGTPSSTYTFIYHH